MSVARLVVVVLLVVAPAWAWNEEGHRTVALVAERRLSPEARRWVTSILSHHPHDVRDLAGASSWPDEVRHSHREFHHGSWHYINLPLFLDIPERPVQVNGKILWAINENTRILKSGDVSVQEKAIALAWLVHLLGDIHQPLHTVNGYSAQLPDGDRGGGLLEVRLGQALTNLHVFWDSAGGLFWRGANHHRLDFMVDGLMQAYPLRQAAAVRSPREWADESYQLAGQVAYVGVAADAQLSQDYIAHARDISQERMALAGYRLAAYIERLRLASD
jgi:hypothetical protein